MSWLACLSLALMAFGSSHAADSGWVSAGGRYLKFYAKAETFWSAEAICLKQGGNLVYDDHPGISAHLELRGGRQWIGATDDGHEGTWTWTNNQPIRKVKWHSGQPDNYRGVQNCAVTNFVQPGRWDDDSCSRKHPFHCQLTPSVSPTIATPLGQICRNGGIRIEKPRAPGGFLCNCPYEYRGARCENWVGAPIQCAGDGNHQDPHQCPSTEFYSCAGSTGWLMRCELGTFYDEHADACLEEYQVRC